jgi:hypothetical protein
MKFGTSELRRLSADLKDKKELPAPDRPQLSQIQPRDRRKNGRMLREIASRSILLGKLIVSRTPTITPNLSRARRALISAKTTSVAPKLPATVSLFQ